MYIRDDSSSDVNSSRTARISWKISNTRETSNMQQGHLRRYDMNRRSQMQGGKNWILQKLVLLMLSLVGNLEKQVGYVPLWDRVEGKWLWTLMLDAALWNRSAISYSNFQLGTVSNVLKKFGR
jgi:hypothetical protein